MIVFDLKCGHGHRFEAWFRDSATYERQAQAGDVLCAVCGDAAVGKALMAPNISKSEDRDRAKAEGPRPGTGELVQKAHAALRQLRDHVEKTHENVGERFPEEVRKMHYGEADERPVYGEASIEEAKVLTEEGIDILPIGPARTDA